MPIRVVNLPFQSACTGLTNPAVWIGPNSRLLLAVSNVTAWGAAAGNQTINLLGADTNPQFTTVIGTAVSGAFYGITSMTITTQTVGGIYPLPYIAPAWVKVQFTTAPTGSTTNAGFINLIVEYDGQTW